MRALVFGGGSGIGLAISMELITRGYHVTILDRHGDVSGYLPEIKYDHCYCDLLDLDEDMIKSLADDQEIDLLMITSGIGRICDFEFYHPAEIKKILTVNTTSVLQIIRLFYNRIKTGKKFYCGIMGSVSGLLPSPMASVYSASKAALCRFIESVNTELEYYGTNNRILNVSPGSFKGSKFYGGDNEPELLKDLAREIVNRLFLAECLFIPQYEEIYKGVLDRYYKDPHEYALYSYEYKKKSGRVENREKVIIGYLSGTFDLFHIGHLNLLRNAKKHCDYLIVGVHDSGAWKGKETFIPFEERVQIVGSCKYVDKVVKSCTEDSDAWDLWHFNRLFVGSDYKGSERFQRYEEFFYDKGVEIIYFPYTQSTSSTQIRKTILYKTKDIEIDK